MYYFTFRWIFLGLVLSCDGFRILGVFPTTSKQNFIFVKTLMTALAERGHNVTVVSRFPLEIPMNNYRDISTAPLSKLPPAEIAEFNEEKKYSAVDFFKRLSETGLIMTSITFSKRAINNLLMSEEKFDLVIVEVAFNEAFLGFGHRFKAPVIAISTLPASSWICDMVGSPYPTSYVSGPFVDYTERMTKMERFWNTYTTAYEKLYYHFYHMPAQQKLYDQYFTGKKKPSLEALRRNVSLVLLNSHFSVRYPRPYAPNMVEVGGLHIPEKIEELPESCKKFLESSSEGAIFALTSSTQTGKRLPKMKVEMLKEAFRVAGPKVLWNWEDSYLKAGMVNDNTLLKRYLPHEPILNNSHVRLFITHGSIMNVMEAAYFGVPILGIPLYGDQFQNLAHAQKRGFAKVIDYYNLTEVNLGQAIKKMLATGMYRRKAKEVSAQFRDQPIPPLDSAIYWVEYIGRHRGASYLHSPGQNLSFLQYHNLDVLINFIVVNAAVLIFSILLFVLFKKIHSMRKKEKVRVAVVVNVGTTSKKKKKKKKKRPTLLQNIIDFIKLPF